jgi:hypothetical protein
MLRVKQSRTIRSGLGVKSSPHSSIEADAKASGLVSRTFKHTRLLSPREVVSVVTLPAICVLMEGASDEKDLSGDDSLLTGTGNSTCDDAVGELFALGVTRAGRPSYSSSGSCVGKKMEKFLGCLFAAWTCACACACGLSCIMTEKREGGLLWLSSEHVSVTDIDSGVPLVLPDLPTFAGEEKMFFKVTIATGSF